MYSYIVGLVVETKANYIVLDNQGIGYFLYVANPFEYKLNIECKVFVFHHVTESSEALFGFKTMDQKDLFIRLISVKGIGPKTALNALTVGGTAEIVQAIEAENIAYLKKMPGIGPKAAQQMILDLKGKLVSKETEVVMNQELDEAIEVLKALDYKANEINRIVPHLKVEKMSTNDYVKKALSLMMK